MNAVTDSVKLTIVDTPDNAPNYGTDTTMLRITDVIVVGKGTVNGNPTVDVQMVDQAGNKYLVMATGGIMEMIGGAVAGKRTKDEEKQSGYH